MKNLKNYESRILTALTKLTRRITSSLSNEEDADNFIINVLQVFGRAYKF